MRKVAGGFVLATLVTLVPSLAFAQVSGIAGVVRDTSGAVMPGVIVEASSPALIEKVRSATTDTQGQYKIVDLRPGTYTVTFTLTGFSTIKREGIELPASFTATVNADLRVGALEETITVSGQSPVVDTQNVVRRQVVDKNTIDAMPTSKNWSTIGIMTIGVSSNQNDVGGSAGEHQNQLKAHGGAYTDTVRTLDGMMLSNMACAYSCTGLSTNDASTQELSYELGAISAESNGGGVRVNIVPKEGGNFFSGSTFFNFANSALQGSNLTDELKAQGVTSTDTVDHLHDFSAAFGGPIVKDKLWFWAATRHWGYSIFRTDSYYELNPLDYKYEADLNNPAADSQPNTSSDIRLTWQISPRNKISAYYDYAPRQTNLWNLSRTTQADASQLQRIKLNHFETITFRSTLNSKMLFEAGFGNMTEDWTREASPDSTTSFGYPVTEQTTGVNFRAYNATFSHNKTEVRSYRSSISYVPGSHAFKFGFNMSEGPSERYIWTTYDSAITVRNAAPFQVTVRTTPYIATERLDADLGLYAQDTWTIRRFTLNLGARFDYLKGSIPEQNAAGGRYIGPRHFEAMDNVPNWKDFGPRIGVAYDLFGNGKTAIKWTLSRYVQQNNVGFTRTVHPFDTSVNNTTRPWRDRDVIPGTNTDSGISKPTDNDGIPQDSELGPLANNNFGKLNIATHYDPDLVTGFGKRRNNWETSASVSHELMSRVAAEVAYYHRAQANFTLTDNLVVTPQDFLPFCVTAPTDSRLPGGGGNQICGLYDVSPAAQARVPNVDNLVTFANNYGGQTEVFNGVDILLNARINSKLFINGGVSTGDVHSNECGARVDSPSARVIGTGIDNFCDTHTGYLTQVKASGAYTMPWDIQLGAVLQNLPGQAILAGWPIVGTQTTLGRNFAAGGALTVNLIEPGTEYTPRRTQLDIRLSKSIRMSGAKRLQLMADIYNLFNSSATVGATSQSGEPPAALNQTYGADWLRPFNILQARYAKFGASFLF